MKYIIIDKTMDRRFYYSGGYWWSSEREHAKSFLNRQHANRTKERLRQLLNNLRYYEDTTYDLIVESVK